MSIITFLIFLGSLAGIVAMLYRKMPLLATLPPDEELGVGDFVKKGVRNLAVPEKLKAVATDKVLKNALAKTRSLAAKTENQTGEWLEKLRQNSQERKAKFSESYWEQFKKKRSKQKPE